jgi:hypothetical protein
METLVPLVEQKLLTLPELLSSPPVFSGVRVTRSLVLYVCFVDRCLSFCTFSFGHCVVCSSSIYGFWLPPFGIVKLFLLHLTGYWWQIPLINTKSCEVCPKVEDNRWPIDGAMSSYETESLTVDHSGQRVGRMPRYLHIDYDYEV